MDTNNQIVAASSQQQEVHEEELRHLNLLLQLVPSDMLNYVLLRRADCFWFLGRYEECVFDLMEVNSNGLPIRVGSHLEGQMIFLSWWIRASEVFESHPSIAKGLFDWCIPHAKTSLVNQTRCLLFKGVAMWLSGDQENGMKLIEEVSETYPDIIEETVSTWKDCGINALNDKDFPIARNLFQRTLILLSSDTNRHNETRSCVLSYLATAYFHLNEYKIAIQKGEEAYELNAISSHDEAEKWKERAETILRKGNFELSIKYCTLALKLTPEERNCANLRCILLSSRCVGYAKTNWYENAMEDAEECVKVNSTTSVTKELYVKFTVEGCNLLESHPLLAKLFFNCSVLHAETPFDKARCLLYKGVAFLSDEQAKGMTIIKEASTIFPDIIEKTVTFWKRQGINALEDKDFPKARNLFLRISILLSSDTRSQHNETRSCVLSNLATAYFHLSEYTSAIQKGEEANKLNPISSNEEAEKWKERAETILREEHFELVIRYCTLGIDLVPQAGENENLRFALLFNRCIAYAKTKKFKPALEDAKKCFTIDQYWPKGHHLLGDILDGLGRHREAIDSYCKAFDVADAHEQSKIMLQILSVSENIPGGISVVRLNVTRDIVCDMIKYCLDDQDWGKLHLMFVGGGGPHKCDYGEGGLATGACDVSDVPLELVVEWGIDKSVEYLPQFIDELITHGASILGSPGCKETPLEVADRRKDQRVIQVLSKYKQTQAKLWRERGTRAYDSGNLEQALPDFNKAIHCEMEFQERLEVHLLLSKIYHKKEDYRNSIDICTKVLDSLDSKEETSSPNIRPIVFELLCLRASSHFNLKDFEQALGDCIKGTKMKPDDIKGYTLLVSCYKELKRHSEMLSALNECLKIECNLDEEWRFLNQAIDVATNLPEGTTSLTANISSKLLKRIHKNAIQSKDWNRIRLLYLGGGGPEKHPMGRGGIVTGRVSASKIAIEDVIAAKFKGKRETLTVLLDHGASVNGLKGESNPLVSAVEKQQVEIAKILLNHGANPCIKTQNHQPLVHKVVQKAFEDTGDLRMLQCFLDSQHRSIESAKDSGGNTVYHLATSKKTTNNKCKVIRLLLDANIDPTIRNKQGNRPVDCCGKRDIRRSIISKFVNEKQKKFDRDSKMLDASKNTDVAQASPHDSTLTEQDSSSASMNIVVTASKSESKKRKKKDIRKELEQLIETVRINERNSEMQLDNEDEQETSQGAAKMSDEEAITEDVKESMIADEETIPEGAKEGMSEIEIDKTKFEDCAWEVEFSEKFKKSFKKLQQEMKCRIVEKIQMLAQGRWNATSCKRIEGEPKRKRIHLYEAKLTKGARILWEKTIAFSARHSKDDSIYYADVIRVWDVVMDHGKLDHEIKNAVRSIERGSQCMMKNKLMGTEKEVPSNGACNPNVYQKCEDNSSDEPNSVTKTGCFPPASPEKNEYNILKFYSFTTPVIEALLNNEGKSEINFPFKVTELEHRTINLRPDPPCPIILLGRSGTGKTTCCLYRLWTEFQNYWESAVTNGPQFPKYDTSRRNSSRSDGTASGACAAASSSFVLGGEATSMAELAMEHFHPLFITKNDVLCNEIRKNFKDLIASNPSMKSVVVCEDTSPNRIQDIEETSWPLIVSSRDWLLLLDASLPGDSFFERKEDGSLKNKVEGWGKQSKHLRSLPVDDDEDHRMEEMQEDHNTTKDKPKGRKSTKVKNLKMEVTYQVFSDVFWPKVGREIRKKIHPTLAWAEIRSFIKGSAEALQTSQGFLSIDEYREIGRKRAPNFKGDRDEIYGLFESYQSFLTSRKMYDEADVVYHLHKRLGNNRELSIHSVYVDETQDFTQAELFLLIHCCRDRNRMFFTGDTAQSIMRGIAFRFDDIRTLLHSLKMSYDGTINVPKKLFQLTHNYRSHNGILKLASSVVKLLAKFFPQSFDKLEEDRGLFDGPKPVLLESCSPSELATILRGNKRHASRIEFGAHQAVLVVSEEARDNMPEELKHGLVLTIYEAKGLEFDDVLIYNFFKDSQAKKEWEVVTDYIIEEQQAEQTVSGGTGLVGIPADRNESFKSRPRKFDYDQHKVLNPEFKLLYTAITRAKVNVWFFDEDEEARGPMFEYFQRLDLVRMDGNNEERDNTFSESVFAESSTKAEWKDTGISFYNQRQWALAEKCFEFADDDRMRSKSQAQRMAQEASVKQEHETFLAAAAEFLKCDMVNEAAECLENAGENLLLEKLHQRINECEDDSRSSVPLHHGQRQ